MFLICQCHSDSSPAYLFLLVPTTVLSPGTRNQLAQKTAGCTGDLQVERWPQKTWGKGVKVTVLKTKLSFGFPHLLKLYISETLHIRKTGNSLILLTSLFFFSFYFLNSWGYLHQQWTLEPLLFWMLIPDWKLQFGCSRTQTTPVFNFAIQDKENFICTKPSHFTSAARLYLLFHWRQIKGP